MTELEVTQILVEMGLTHPSMDELAGDQEPLGPEDQQILDTSADIVFKG